MRHRVSGRRLGRGPSHQKAMFRALAAALITHEHIETTDARAKELRRVADRLVTLGKKGTLHARRQAYKFLNNHQLVQKLFDEIAPRFKDRPGGYTRLIKSRIRVADQAPMTFVRFVDEALPEKKEVEKAPKTASTVESQVKAAVEEELEAGGDATAAETAVEDAQEEAADESTGAEGDTEATKEEKESKE
ncbi:MAG: 50S ribosomal protein L17 [Deltaproteobacteria bacterium]|nr:50S ribosomal protein L17 [Deltaproteobacteria bacterium]